MRDEVGTVGGTEVDETQCRDLMLKVYGSVLPPHSVIYCSAPLTSGKRFLDWLASMPKTSHDIDHIDRQERKSHLSNVVMPNKEHARQFVEQLRSRDDRPVIDPTAVPHIAAWRQLDWLSFWEEVIACYASEIIFLNDWEFSFGCVHEFWFAHRFGLPAYDECGQRIGLLEGLERITNAVRAMRESGVSTARLEEVVRQLHVLAAKRS